ncbi:MAG: response regulator [Planctomycetota bacterium]
MSQLDRSTTLLLVDDDPCMMRLLAKIIERSFGNRMQLHSLTDPKEARQWIEQNLVDILVTDLEMPGVNGLELLRCAKRKNPCAQVLFVTGHSTLEALTDALELGATDYLLKPLDQTELIELIEDAEKRLRRWRQALSGTATAKREVLVAAGA